MTGPNERLDDALNKRRVELDMTWGDLAARARISEVTLRAIRAGSSRPSDLTRRRLEDALDWAHGSIDTVMAGGDPTPAPSVDPDVVDSQLATLLQIEQQLAGTLEQVRQDIRRLRSASRVRRESHG